MDTQQKWEETQTIIKSRWVSQYSVKPYNITNYNKLFADYPDKNKYMKHIKVLTHGVRIGLAYPFQPRFKITNPIFSVAEKLGIGTQVAKWLKTGIVIGPISNVHAHTVGITLNMLFGVPKPDGSTRPILNMSDKSVFNYSVNDLLDPLLCTVEYAQMREVVHIVRALGKGAYLWAKDIQDGYYNVSVHKNDIYDLGFVFENKIYIFQRLPMGLSSSP
ncbi:MAG: hypothetical protein GY907_09930, partial [Bacteroidetes bacterium]|nr:hypothetical protein [Bacteroidota bacterium]